MYIYIYIYSKFTPNKLVAFDDRSPNCINDFIKTKINR